MKPKIVIVAGGLAKRLLPITEKIPKCLVDVNGKPSMQHQIEFFRDNGFTDIIFCVAHLADKVKEFFGDGKWLGVNISYSVEPNELLGTAGSVKLAQPLIGSDENFIVYYGDDLTSMDFDKFVRFHEEKGGLATICMRPRDEGQGNAKIEVHGSEWNGGTSILTLDEDSRVTLFLERPTVEEISRYAREKNYFNAGIYVLNRRVFDLIPENQKFGFAEDVFPRMLGENLKVYGYATTEYYREIGRVEKYNRFLEEVKGKDNIFSPSKAGTDKA